jgi:hypothetical protein
MAPRTGRVKAQRFHGLAAAAILLAGCANIHNDQTRTKVEGTAAGAVAGGIIGGVIGGAVSMGSPSYIAQGAILGAEIGGGAGYQYGKSVAEKKSQYATEEAWLDACIAEVKSTTGKSQNYNQLAKGLLARQQVEIASILKDGQATPESRDRAAKLRQALDASVTNLNVAIRSWDHVLESHRAVVQRYQPAPQVEALGQQVDELDKSQDELRQDFESFTVLRKELGP